MLFNFILHSMRDELDKVTTPAIKNKQWVAYTVIEIFRVKYKQGRIYSVRILCWKPIYTVRNSTP